MKRKIEYETVMCQHCNNPISINKSTISFICGCGKRSSMDEARKYYEENSDKIIDKSSDLGFPAIHGVSPSRDGYRKLRDEMQIRSDMYTKKIRRNTVGPQKFKRMLKKELIHEKCYRGKASGVD